MLEHLAQATEAAKHLIGGVAKTCWTSDDFVKLSKVLNGEAVARVGAVSAICSLLVTLSLTPMESLTTTELQQKLLHVAAMSTVTALVYIQPEWLGHPLVTALSRCAPSMAPFARRYSIKGGIQTKTWSKLVEPKATGGRLMQLVQSWLDTERLKRTNPQAVDYDVVFNTIKFLVVETNMLVQAGQYALSQVLFMRVNTPFLLQRRFPHLNIEEDAILRLR